jgi:hypothetical protein
MSRLESLDDDFPKLDLSAKDSEPAQIEYLVKNTFIDGLADTWSALRSWSLEEFLKERHIKSAPNSGIMQRLESLDEEAEEPSPVSDEMPNFPRTPSFHSKNMEPLDEDVYEPPPEDTPVMVRSPSTPSNSPVIPSAVSHEYPQPSKEWLPAVQFDQFAMEQLDARFLEDQHQENVEEPQVVVELNSVLGNWSVGSTGHHFGRCKPCAFFWKDSCNDGQACQFCHSCPPDEKKKRTKQKVQWRRNVRAARTALRYGLY